MIEYFITTIICLMVADALLFLYMIISYFIDKNMLESV